MALLTDLEKQEIESSHLNLDWSSIDFSKLRDPFSGYYSTDSYNEILKAIRDPRNFFWTCKYIFNVELTVFQLVWLDQLWNYSYPMLIASRGASKSFTEGVYYALRATITQGCKVVIAAPTFRQSKIVFEYIENIWNNAPIWRNLCGDNSTFSHMPEMYKATIGKSTIVAIPLGNGDKIRGLRANYVNVQEFNCMGANTLLETNYGLMRMKDAIENENILLLNQDGVYEKPIRRIITPPTDVYEVVTERGYSFKCSNKHKVFTTKGIKLAKDLSSEDCIISENKYIFPENLIEKDGVVLDNNMAWLFGILISEGYISDKNTFGIGMTDNKCVDKFCDSIIKINPYQHIYYYKKEGYYDERLKCLCKKSYHATITNQRLRNKLANLGLDREKALQKKIPWSILQSPRHIVVQFLSGLFEGDGCAILFEDTAQSNRLRLIYTTASEQLCNDISVLLKKLGYLCNIQKQKSQKGINFIYHININGLNAYQLGVELNIERFKDKINNCYEKDIEDKPTINYAKSINKYLVYCRVDGKYKRVGTTKTYEEALELYNKHNIEHLVVKKVTLLPKQEILYDFELPFRHNFFGNNMLQHNSVNEEVFEVVLQGFIATSSNPVENIKTKAKIKKLKEKGLLTKQREEEILGLYKANQIILSGTTGWDFQPFAKRWKKYRKIIKSGGDPAKLKEAFGGEVDKEISHKDFCIIRIPVDLLPDGLMDNKAIAQARANNDPSRFNLEYGAVFSKDSNGFFPRTLIESCVTKEPIILGNQSIQFSQRIRGDSAHNYILAIDPASESDNLAIVIIENFNNHNRIVYCWTAQRKDVMKRFKEKSTDENNFYAFIARKVRILMQTFNIKYIALDTQGGGAAVSEALHDLKRLEGGELPIWPICKEDPMFYPGTKDYGYDEEAGLHMVEMVNFSNAQYVLEANHGLRKDLMNKMLLFPYADAVTLATAEMFDKYMDEEVDTLQNCIYEIEQLKDEMSTIVHTTTLNGRDRWDAPETIMPGGKKGKLRKDRYSALLMCNMLARRLFRESTIDYDNRATGGFAQEFKGQEMSGQAYVGPSWFTDRANNSLLGRSVSHQKDSDPFGYYGQDSPQYSS